MTSDEHDLPETLSFSAPPSKHGNYYIFHIPNSLIKSGEINPEYIYKVTIKPLKKRE
ncbi:MAG: hypothetical protein ACFFAS_20455 [Promethearchaeota archaeon]